MTNVKKKKIASKKAVLERIKFNAAGIDLSSQDMYVAVIDKPVVKFSTFTCGIKECVKYLNTEDIGSIAIEATGIYWFPIYEALEESGFEIYIVNGRHAKNVPGRKTDVLDSEWLRELHTYGLLRASFIPKEEIRKLRYYMRLRKDHIASKAACINHVQKNLDAMNIKLHTVISDIMGESGQKVVRAIANGETSAEKLSGLCNADMQKRKGTEILKALEGKFREEYLFALNQALEIYDFYFEKIRSCDVQIENLLLTMTIQKDEPQNLSPMKCIRHNMPQIKDFHYLMVKLSGNKDATAIAGINDYSFLQIISETGLDLQQKWPTNGHFTSWLGLAPPLNKSGKGPRQKKKFKRKVNNAGEIFKQIAQNVGNGKHCALSGFYKRIKGRSGASIANKAAARKIAVYYYELMTKGIDFVEEGIKRYEERYKAQKLKYLFKQAQEFGFELVCA
jgi:transposase